MDLTNFAMGLFSGDMNGDGNVNITDTTQSINYMLNRRPILSIISVNNDISQDSNSLSSTITFLHSHSTGVLRSNKYYLLPYVGLPENQPMALNEFPFSGNLDDYEIFSSSTNSTFEVNLNFNDNAPYTDNYVFKFLILYISSNDISDYYKYNFNFISPSFTIAEHNMGSLGLFSGDMNGDGNVNITDTTQSINYMLNRRPILSIISVNNDISQDSNSLSSTITFLHSHSTGVLRSNKYYLLPYVGLPENQPMALNEFPFSGNLDDYEIFSSSTNSTFEVNLNFNDNAPYTDNYVFKFLILYISSNDISDYYKYNFNFITPAFKVSGGFDLVPGYSLVNYENNATLIARITDITIAEGDVLAAYNEDNKEIHSYESLRDAKNVPALSTGVHYFGGAIGLDTGSLNLRYKFYDSSSKRLSDLHMYQVELTQLPLDLTQF